MDKPSKTETSLYLIAMTVILLAALSMCCYYDGRTDEDLRESREQDQLIDAAVQRERATLLAEVSLQPGDGE